MTPSPSPAPHKGCPFDGPPWPEYAKIKKHTEPCIWCRHLRFEEMVAENLADLRK